MMNDVFFGLMMLGGFFVLGIGMWALGQWLRRKGFGPQLDALDTSFCHHPRFNYCYTIPENSSIYDHFFQLNQSLSVRKFNV